MPSVILTIKTPSLKLSDLTHCCDAGSSVHQLKLYLQSQYPSKPQPEEQRLIYQGKLLRDDEVLQDFLRDLDKEQKHTLHLVYTLKRTPSAEAQDRQNVQSVEASSSANEGLRLRHTVANTPEVSPGLHAEMQDWNTMQNLYPGWASNASGADDMARQFLWWQQTYQQYWSQYLYHINNGQQAPVTPNTQPPQQAPTTPVAPPPAPANLEPPRQEVPRAPQLVAVGGVAQEDDEEARVARDWLDWMYVGSRLAILIGVMYYYSSLPRFMLVTLIVAGIYLYQKAIIQRRRNALRRNAEANNNRAPQAEAPQPTEAPEVVDNAQPANEPNPEEDVAARNEGNERNQNAPSPNGLNVALNLLVGFFTSLIPEVPAPDALN